MCHLDRSFTQLSLCHQVVQCSTGQTAGSCFVARNIAEVYCLDPGLSLMSAVD